MTKGLDVLIRDSEANAHAIFKALAEFGAPLSAYTVSDFHGHPTCVIQLGIPPNRIDLIQSIEGVTAEHIWKDRVQLAVDSELTASFISLEHLIQNKQAVGRLSDLADVDELQKVNKRT